MGKIIASCNHEITFKEMEEGGCYLVNCDKEGEKELSYLVLCPACRKSKKKEIKQGEKLAKELGLIE